MNSAPQRSWQTPPGGVLFSLLDNLDILLNDFLKKLFKTSNFKMIK